MSIEYGLESAGERPAVEALMRANEWETDLLDEGEVWVARDDGEVIGVVHLVEVAPGMGYVPSALVRDDRRGRGVGSAFMRAIAAARPGEIYLACHDNRIPFYERLGYAPVQRSDLPAPALEYAFRAEDISDDPGHVHHLMRFEGTP